MSQTEVKDTMEISIFELVLAVAKRKRFVLCFTLLTAVLVTAVVFIMPRKWRSESLIVPIADDASTIQFNTEFMSSFNNVPLLGSEKKDIALSFLTILGSRTFREDIIRKFNLINYFGINEPDSSVAMEIALRKYNNSIFLATLEQQTNSIRIYVTTRERHLSKDMAEYIEQALEKYVKSNKRVKSSMTREFLEQRTNAVKTRIDTLLVINKMLESKGKTFALSEQKTQVLTIYSDLVSQKFVNDIELELGKQQYGADSPQIKKLEAKSKLLKHKIEALESSAGGITPKYILNLDDIPEINMDYSRIQVELDVMNQVYQYLYPILEMAKLTELREMPQFDVLDRPSLAGLHASPKRLLVIVMVTLAGLLLASLMAVVDEFMAVESRETLRQIKSEFGKNRKKSSPSIKD